MKGKKRQIIPFFISFPCLKMNVKNLLNFAVIRNYGTCTLLQILNRYANL